MFVMKKLQISKLQKNYKDQNYKKKLLGFKNQKS
jgi:hypothetical protein